MKVSIAALDGSPVLTGPAYAYADSIYDAFSGRFTGDQWFVITQTRPSKLLKHFGWAGYVGFSGLEFLGNYGYLSASIPGASGNKKPTLGSSNAGAAAALKGSGTLVKTIGK